MSEAKSPGAASSVRLSFETLFAFAILGVPLSLLMTPLGTVLPAFYSEHTQVPLAAIGLALGLTRIADALFDPVVGVWVDQTRTRFGSRKPWIVLGVIVMLPSMYMLLNPPSTANTVYLFVALTLVSAAFSLISIPYTALGSVITEDYHERSRVVAWRSLSGFAGSLAFLTIPFMIGGETKISPDVMRYASIGVGIAFPLVLIWFLIQVQDPPKPAGEARVRYRDFIQLIKDNGPFRFFLIAMLIRGLGEGMFQGSFVLFISKHLGMAERVPHMLALITVVYLVATVIWARVLPGLPKNKTVFWSSLVFALASPFWLLVARGPEGFPILMAIVVVQGVAISAATIVLPAILADVIDYGTWKGGKSTPAMYFSTFLLTEKINLGLGMALGLVLLGLFGFEAGESREGLANIGGYLVVIVFPALLVLLSSLLWFRFPINEGRQRALRSRINAREASAARLAREPGGREGATSP